MRILSYSFEAALTLDAEVRDHSFVLRCEPATVPGQTVLEAQTAITPPCHAARQVDGFGSPLLVGSIEGPHRGFSFVSAGLVMVDRAGAPAPEPAHPIFSNPSALTRADEGIRAFTADVLRVCPNADPLSKAVKLSRALHERMAYTPGSTDVSTTAAEAFGEGAGVCQDYAHILIAALRHTGAPARYVSGLIEGEGATHAWVEVHDGEAWRGVDPTNDRLVDDGYIMLAHGRDFSDCPIERGVFRGSAAQAQTVKVTVGDR